jgi:hypothetical protein
MVQLYTNTALLFYVSYRGRKADPLNLCSLLGTFLSTWGKKKSLPYNRPRRPRGVVEV